MVEMIDRESLRLNTRALIRQLREAASRANNKSYEEAARNAAAHMENLLMLYTDALEQADKQDEKIADMAERIQGWKSLVESINERLGPMARRTADETAAGKTEAPKKNNRYNYDAVLGEFVASRDELRRIPTTFTNKTGTCSEGMRSARYPSFYTMRDHAKKKKFPVTVLWDNCTSEICLIREVR